MAQEFSEFSRPIPGQSMTVSKDSQRPFSTPPETTSVEDALERMFVGMKEKVVFDGICDSLRDEIPAEDIAKMLAFEAFRSGKVTPDVSLLLVEPLIYLMVYIADLIGVEAVVYPEGDGDLDDDEIRNALKGTNSTEGTEDDVEEGNAPEGVSTGLLDIIKAKVKDKGE